MAKVNRYFSFILAFALLLPTAYAEFEGAHVMSGELVEESVGWFAGR